jgi:hypothetical protein
MKVLIDRLGMRELAMKAEEVGFSMKVGDSGGSESAEGSPGDSVRFMVSRGGCAASAGVEPRSGRTAVRAAFMVRQAHHEDLKMSQPPRPLV